MLFGRLPGEYLIIQSTDLFSRQPGEQELLSTRPPCQKASAFHKSRLTWSDIYKWFSLPEYMGLKLFPSVNKILIYVLFSSNYLGQASLITGPGDWLSLNVSQETFWYLSLQRIADYFSWHRLTQSTLACIFIAIIICSIISDPHRLHHSNLTTCLILGLPETVRVRILAVDWKDRKYIFSCVV